MKPLPVPLSALAFALLVLPAAAQRGRGRSEAIVQRVGCFFVEGKLDPAAANPGDPLQGVTAVREAAAAHHLALVYLFDPKADKREQYEQVVFGSDETGVALRCFRCIKLDVSSDPSLAKYANRTPLFVAFGADGKQSGELTQPGYKATINPIIKLLEKAAAGHVKPSLAQFVQAYRELVHELEMGEGRKKNLDDRQSRLQEKDAAKRAELDKERKQLEAELKQLDGKETEMLRQAKVPPRAPGATRMGERPRR